MEENTKPIFVVDASFVLAFLLRDGNCQQTDVTFKKYRDDKISLVAPELLFYEVANGLKSACLTKRINQKQCVELLLLSLSLDIKKENINWNDVLETALTKKTSCYDASYVVLSRRLNAKLLTFDRKMQ